MFGQNRRKSPGKPKTNSEIEKLIVVFAEENPSWGYDRIMDTLSNLGYEVSNQTIGSILKKYGIPPSPQREASMSWAQFIKMHENVLAACDFCQCSLSFTAPVTIRA